MRIFISGGCKCGKSSYAQTLAMNMRKDGLPLYYIATMIPADDEDVRRIENHRLERKGLGFETIEAARSISAATAHCDPNGSFLLDSVTALLANEMFDSCGNIDREAGRKTLDDLITATQRFENIIFVSDYIFSDATQYDSVTELYRKSLAGLGVHLAAVCDQVLEMCCGNIIVHKYNK